MEKQEIVEVKANKERKAVAKSKTTSLKVDAEIKLDKVKISLYHGVNTEVLYDVWGLIKKYVG
ncbi:hypothetical protein [Ligilactobacillus salivarius]|uniref:hypothetical protein n=1 Tax=Ligilactobacillus salivarius TaxID=1624 RepID=UPI002B47493B|nr:hypothetical protein [Ligilactobacillus salivarius]